MEKYIDEELILAYIGETSKTLKNKFNWKMTLINTFLQSMWYLYNKAYVCFILTELVSFFTPFPIMFFINGFCGEDFYLKEIKRKIEKIKRKNPHLSREELIELLRKKGKKNSVLIYVIIGSLILLIIMGFLVILAFLAEVLTLGDTPTFLDGWF